MTHDTLDQTTTRSHGWRIALWGSAVALLALPAVAMQFTDEVAWTAGDFLVFGAMLAIAGLLIELVVRIARTVGWRIAGIALVALGFLLVWAELAVGLFD